MERGAPGAYQLERPDNSEESVNATVDDLSPEGYLEAADTTEVTDEYESPRVFDLGGVVEVTRGSSSGAGDSNGQAMY